MPCIDITGINWDEVGPDLYLALRELVDLIEKSASLPAPPGIRYAQYEIIAKAVRAALARVEGKE